MARSASESFNRIQLALQDVVFRGQIFVPRQQLLIHRPGNVGKDARPVHSGPLAPTVVPEWRRHWSPQECARRSAEPLSGPRISDRVLCRFSFLTLRGPCADLGLCSFHGHAKRDRPAGHQPATRLVEVGLANRRTICRSLRRRALAASACGPNRED
jgi:hypothetical protein